jgi:hypothetical protein
VQNTTVAPDTTAPTVSITSPANGSTIGRSVTVTVNAQDNVQVVRTELYVNGSKVATSTSAPFTLKWNPRKVSAGQYQVYVKAFDAAGNAGTSSSITLIK